jgi:HAD superfamily hydrolase (TIGR01450 family)
LAARPSRVAIECIENTEFDTTNNMYSLSLVASRLGGEAFYLSNGDVVFNRGVLDLMGAVPPDQSCIAVDRSSFYEESMKIAVNAAGLICGLSKKYTRQESFATSIDIYRFSAAASQQLFGIVQNYIRERRERHHWTEVAIDEILKTERHDIHPVDITGHPWVEVDNFADLAQADILFSPYRGKIAAAKTFVFDIDGTIAVGGNPIAGAVETVHRLQSEKSVLFCTNNSSRSRAEYGEFLQSLGIKCRAEDIISSIGSAISFLRRRRMHSLFVLGTPSLQKELTAAGFVCDAAEPEIVVIGFDKTLAYERAARACNLVAAGCTYILTHPDAACPSPTGPIPDAGAIGAMIQAATGVAPIAVLGKPSREMLLPLFEERGLRPAETVMTGDRLSTDTLMARNAGCLSVLVLSGMTSRLEADRSAIKPSLIIDDLSQLITAMGYEFTLRKAG